MKIENEINLLLKLYKYHENKTEYLYHEIGQISCEDYISQDILNIEIEKIFNSYPTLIAFSSELKCPGDYLVKNILGNSYIISRQNDLSLKAFNNVCRHRGALLLSNQTGNKQVFVCPYHRWQYRLSGELETIPKDIGFDGLKKCDLGLRTIFLEEYKGMIFAYLGKKSIELKDLMAPLKEEFDDLFLDQHEVFSYAQIKTYSNWKQSIEQFLEIYHLKSVHKDSISRFFLDGVQVSDSFDPHIRFTFARKQLLELLQIPKSQWRIRNFANMIYYIFPNSVLLFQQDHHILATFWPDGPNDTMAEYRFLIHKDTSKEKLPHFELNDKIMRLTIDEDIAIGKNVQQNYLSHANKDVYFGKFEASLTLLHQAIDKAKKLPQ